MKEYYIGIDGGGTNSTVLVSDGNKDIDCFSVGGFNYNSFPKKNLIENIDSISIQLHKIGLSVEGCIGVCLGSAGVGNKDAVEFLEKGFKDAGYINVLITGDEVIALHGAFGKEDGILLISGTGSICYGQCKSSDRMYRVGGWGHLIDDEGSGYALGRDILSETVRELDGRVERTALVDVVFEYLKISTIEELISYVYNKEHSKKEIASIAIISTDERVKELPEIKKLVEKASNELVKCVSTIYGTMKKSENISKDIQLVLAGSVLTKNMQLNQCFIEKLALKLPQIEVVTAKQDAPHGAIWMLQH